MMHLSYMHAFSSQSYAKKATWNKLARDHLMHLMVQEEERSFIKQLRIEHVCILYDVICTSRCDYNRCVLHNRIRQ